MMAELKKTFSVPASSPPPLLILPSSPLLKHKFLKKSSHFYLSSTSLAPLLGVLSTPQSISVLLINNQSAGAEAKGPAPSVSIGKPERERERKRCERMRGEREEIEFNLSPSIFIRGQIHSASIDHNLERCNCWSETEGWMLGGVGGEGVNNVSTVQSNPLTHLPTLLPDPFSLFFSSSSPPLCLCLLLTSPALFSFLYSIYKDSQTKTT